MRREVEQAFDGEVVALPGDDLRFDLRPRGGQEAGRVESFRVFAELVCVVERGELIAGGAIQTQADWL